MAEKEREEKKILLRAYELQQADKEPYYPIAYYKYQAEKAEKAEKERDEKKIQERAYELQQADREFHYPIEFYKRLAKQEFAIGESKNKKTKIGQLTDWWETTRLEKFLEDLDYLLKKLAVIDIIDSLAKITIIISLISWTWGWRERWENEIFSTWEVVQNAQKDKSGVPKLAVKRLLKNNFSLSGFNFSNTNLAGANLQSANLEDSNLEGVNLEDANLKDVKLEGANLQGANLQGANLIDATLIDVYFPGANLEGANLYGANLYGANLEVTKDLTKKQIKGACFWKQAIYKGNFDYKKQTWVVDKKANQQYIEELKQHDDSDPDREPDCSRIAIIMNYE